MGQLILFIIVVVCLLLFIQWRVAQAQKKIETRPVPELLKQDHPNGLLLYFYHPACGPCKKMAAQIDNLATQYPEQVMKFNVLDQQDFSLAFGIKATPTTIIVKNNQIARAFIGYQSAQKLETFIQPAQSTTNS